MGFEASDNAFERSVIFIRGSKSAVESKNHSSVNVLKDSKKIAPSLKFNNIEDLCQRGEVLQVKTPSSGNRFHDKKFLLACTSSSSNMEVTL